MIARVHHAVILLLAVIFWLPAGTAARATCPTFLPLSYHRAMTGERGQLKEENSLLRKTPLSGKSELTLANRQFGAKSPTCSFNPFGKLIGKWGPMADANVMQFSSMPQHDGLVFYPFRVYDPNLQRWPNRDPLGDSSLRLARLGAPRNAHLPGRMPIELIGGPNLYEFNYNSPLYYIDPDGLTPRGAAWGAAIGMGIGGLLGGTIGGAGGTLAAPGVGTLAGAGEVGAAGAAWGTALGAAAGNAISDLFKHPPCNQMAKGKGSDGGHGPGDNDIIKQVAKDNDIDPHDFGDYVEEYKQSESIPNNVNLSYSQLQELADWYNAGF